MTRSTRYLRLTCLLLAAALIAPGGAAAFEGFRGATWGELRWHMPEEGDDNLVLNGWIRQGVDWAKWGNTTLNTYGILQYRWDTERLDWNNMLGPGVGIALDTYTGKGLALSVGAEYIWESRILDDGAVDRKAIVYMGWYGWWDLKR
ncbi:MAG TPA: hypothetical protein ENO23_09595 [Alphaproteobacteria bacterium]|nr:hypothetical protein [Alphaproteobacteria bacterium]